MQKLKTEPTLLTREGKNVSIGDMFSNPVVTFLIGLSISIITLVFEFVKYFQSRIREKREPLIPFLRRMHGNVSKIIDLADSKNLRKKYEEVLSSKVAQKLVENASQQVMEAEKIDYSPNNVSSLSPAYFTELLFLNSYHSFEDLIKECIKFETVLGEMETEGLTNTLKVKDKGLYQRINNFHSVAEAAADNVKKGTIKIDSVKDITDFHINYQKDSLEQLFISNILVYNILNFGSDLEKALRRFL